MNIPCKIQKVPKREFIRLKDRPDAPVWIRGEYCRETKGYEISKFDDISCFRTIKKDTIVYMGFTF